MAKAAKPARKRTTVAIKGKAARASSRRKPVQRSGGDLPEATTHPDRPVPRRWAMGEDGRPALVPKDPAKINWEKEERDAAAMRQLFAQLQAGNAAPTKVSVSYTPDDHVAAVQFFAKAPPEHIRRLVAIGDETAKVAQCHKIRNGNPPTWPPKHNDLPMAVKRLAALLSATPPATPICGRICATLDEIPWPDAVAAALAAVRAAFTRYDFLAAPRIWIGPAPNPDVEAFVDALPEDYSPIGQASVALLDAIPADLVAEARAYYRRARDRYVSRAAVSKPEHPVTTTTTVAGKSRAKGGREPKFAKHVEYYHALRADGKATGPKSALPLINRKFPSTPIKKASQLRSLIHQHKKAGPAARGHTA